jgi:PmbA protein
VNLGKKKSAAKKRAAKKSAAKVGGKKPAAKKAAVKKAAAKKGKKPAAKKPAAKKPAAKKAAAKKKSAAKKPAAKKPAAKKPAAKKPAAKKAAAKKPAAKKPAAKKSAAVEPAAKVAASSKAAAKKAAAKPPAKRKAPAVIAATGDSLSRASQRHLDDLEACATAALEHLRKRGVEHAEIAANVGERLETGIRQGEVELVKEAKSRGLSVRVVHGERVATSSTTDLGREAVERFLDRVIEMAELSEADPLAVPPDPSELLIGAGAELPALDLWDDEIGRIKADRALQLALQGERAAFAHDHRITSSEGANFSRGASHGVLATSGGFIGRSAGTYASLVVQVIADDVGGKKRNGYEWTAGRHFAQLDDPAVVGRKAAERAVRSLGSVKIETGVHPVVFERDAARGIIGLVASCIVGDAVYRHQSYLESRLGTQVASSLVTIFDDPLLVRAPGSRPYDGEGRAVQRIGVIEAGELHSFLLDTYSARKLKLAPTSSAGGGGGIPHATTSNFFMRAGISKPDELLKGIDRGLYVTSMMGFGFDPVTGNFSRGASGFLIENGELSVPVSEVTVSRNLDELLRGIDMVADDLDHRAAVSSPSFRVDYMTISGI